MLGVELRTIRKRRGLSAGSVAESAGLSKSTLTSIERGERYPSLETLEALASCLRVTLIIGPDETIIEPVV